MIFKKKKNIFNLLIKNINYNTKKIKYKNDNNQNQNTINTNISRNINNHYLKTKLIKINCDEDNFSYKDPHEDEDEDGVRLLPDINPPDCKFPNCEPILDMFGNNLIDKLTNKKTKRYKKDILYYNYTTKQTGEEDVDILIQNITEDIKEIENDMMSYMSNLEEFLNDDDKNKECYKKMFFEKKNLFELMNAKIIKSEFDLNKNFYLIGKL